MTKYDILFSHGGDVMKIVPMRDLKNTVEIERKCAEENGPVFFLFDITFSFSQLVAFQVEISLNI